MGDGDNAPGPRLLSGTLSHLPSSLVSLYVPCFLPAPNYYLNTYDGRFTTLRTTGFDRGAQMCSPARRDWRGDPDSTGTLSTSCSEPCSDVTDTLPERPAVSSLRLGSLAVPQGPACFRVALRSGGSGRRVCKRLRFLDSRFKNPWSFHPLDVLLTCSAQSAQRQLCLQTSSRRFSISPP